MSLQFFKTIICVIVLGASMSACTTAQFFYNRLDWYVGWKIGRYVDLESDQERAFEQAVDRVHLWHRRNALPIYTRDLQQIVSDSEKSVTADDVETWAARAAEHWNMVVRQIVPEACALVPRLSDEQVASVAAHMEERIQEKVEKYLEPPEAEVREASEKRIRKNLKRWFGRLSDDQEQKVHQFAQSRPLHYQDWIESRRQWSASLISLMRERHSEQFCSRLKRQLLYEDFAANSRLDEDRTLRIWSTFLSEFFASLSPTQLEYFKEKLMDVAQDFDALWREQARI